MFLLQETHAISSDKNAWQNQWPGSKMYFNGISTRSCGQIIILTSSFEVINHCIIIPGRLQKLKLKKGDVNVSVINVYGPNLESERENFLVQLRNIIEEGLADDYMIIGGDFNMILNPKLDKQGGASFI